MSGGKRLERALELLRKVHIRFCNLHLLLILIALKLQEKLERFHLDYWTSN